MQRETGDAAAELAAMPRPTGWGLRRVATDAAFADRTGTDGAKVTPQAIAATTSAGAAAPIDATLSPEIDAPATPEDLVGALGAHVRAQGRRVMELELALADAQARILSQAQLLCGAGNDGEGGLFHRRSVRDIVEEVLLAYPGIGWADVIGIRRERRLVAPRHACMAAVYDEREDLSLPALGRIFRRDHSSVLHAVNKGRAKR